MAGISAAFGGVFGTPLAGAFFGMEMCFVGKLQYRAGVYCLLASFVGDAVTTALGAPRESYAIGMVPQLGPSSLAFAVLAAVVFGIAARMFSGAIRVVKRFYAAHITNYLVAALVGAFVVLGTYVVFGLYDYGGLSSWLVEAGFTGAATPVDALLKLAMTALTLGAGFQGGEVTPIFGIGASLGGWLGAALGMVGVFGSALNVPMTTILLGVDLFGGLAAPYFVIVSFVSYLVAGHRGVYPAQRIVTPKWRSLEADQGHTVNEVIADHHEKATRAS